MVGYKKQRCSDRLRYSENNIAGIQPITNMNVILGVSIIRLLDIQTAIDLLIPFLNMWRRFSIKLS